MTRSAEINEPLGKPGVGDAGFLDEARSLACIHCGLCLGSCPTYLETGNENDSPRGRIYLMRGLESGRFELNATTVGHLDLCLGCLACEAACPSGVEYRVLLEGTREHIERRYRRGLWQRFLKRVAIEWILPYPSRLNVALWPARLAYRLSLGRLLPAWMRETVALACQPRAREPLAPFHPATGSERRGTVGFVPGCVMSVVFGPTNAASVGLLNRAGYDVKIPRGQGCCGALHLHGGRLEEAREFARRNVAAFGADKLEAIIINAAGCGSALKEYGHLLQDDVVWAERAKEFTGHVKDLSEFLAGVPGFKESLVVAPGASGRVAFHDACHLAHAQRIVREPRELVRAVAGEKLVAMLESDVCCGGAGSYFLTEPGMATRLQDRKIDHIERCGAETIVTTNPGCLMQIRAGLRRRGQGKVRVMHLADYLWERVAGAGGGRKIEDGGSKMEDRGSRMG